MTTLSQRARILSSIFHLFYYPPHRLIINGLVFKPLWHWSCHSLIFIHTHVPCFYKSRRLSISFISVNLRLPVAFFHCTALPYVLYQNFNDKIMEIICKDLTFPIKNRAWNSWYKPRSIHTRNFPAYMSTQSFIQAVKILKLILKE